MVRKNMKSSESLRSLPGHTSIILEEYVVLKMVILSRYSRGEVKKIETAAEEPFWSVNIKRGVLNLLQVNLEGDKQAPIAGLESVFMQNKLVTEDAITKVYRVFEVCTNYL